VRLILDAHECTHSRQHLSLNCNTTTPPTTDTSTQSDYRDLSSNHRTPLKETAATGSCIQPISQKETSWMGKKMHCWAAFQTAQTPMKLKHCCYRQKDHAKLRSPPRFKCCLSTSQANPQNYRPWNCQMHPRMLRASNRGKAPAKQTHRLTTVRLQTGPTG